MKKVAIFGNAGGGKSTLARKLAELTRLPLHVLDIVEFPAGGRGGKIPADEYRKQHAELLQQEAWIIDGYGNTQLAWERFAIADTLVHVDLPLSTHFRWVTKRFVKGLFAPPPGWPENTPLFASTLDSYRVLWLCNRHLTPKYRQLVSEARGSKRVHHLRSPAEISAFLEVVRQEVHRV